MVEYGFMKTNRLLAPFPQLRNVQKDQQLLEKQQPGVPALVFRTKMHIFTDAFAETPASKSSKTSS